MAWWQEVDWRPWLQEASVVDRPTETQAIINLALRSKPMRLAVMEYQAETMDGITRALTREVIRESAHDMTLRELLELRGKTLEWVNVARPGQAAELIRIEVDLTKRVV